MHRSQDIPWRDIPDWAFDLMQLQLTIMAQNEAIMAALESRDSRLTPEDQALVNKIAKVAGNINRKIDAAQRD